jgi:type VI protein secretion system component VasF
VWIFVEKDEERSELGRRISADLRERAEKTSEREDVDLVEDSEYLKNMQHTNRFSWFWFILVFLAAAALVVIFIVH